MDKLTNLIDQVEKKISHIIVLLSTFIKFPFIKISTLLTPYFAKLSMFLQNIARTIIHQIIVLIQVFNSLVGPRAWNYYKHKAQNFMQKVQEEKAEKIKLLKINNPNDANLSKKENVSDFGLLFDAFINRLTTISPLKFALMGVLFLILLINSFHFISTSSDLVSTIQEDHSSSIRREIASSVDDIPTYYNDIARISGIKGLKIPAYASSVNKIKNLEIDTQILFYNRSGKQFFDEYVIVFLDHLEMTMEPIQPSFPLSPEGKMIIKEKIKNEINFVFKEHGVKSRVENVFFTNIFAN